MFNYNAVLFVEFNSVRFQIADIELSCRDPPKMYCSKLYFHC